MPSPVRASQTQQGTPVTVTGATNSAGTDEGIARVDHVHRLEVAAQDDAVAIGARPTVNFTGAGVTVTDDGGNDRINVDIPGGAGSLAGLPGVSYEDVTAFIDANDRNSYPTTGGATVTDMLGNLTAGTLNGGAALEDGGFRFINNADSLTFTKNADTDNLFATGGTLHVLLRPLTQPATPEVVMSTQNASDNLGWRLRVRDGSSGRVGIEFDQTFDGADGTWRTFNVAGEADPTPEQDLVTGVRPIGLGELVAVSVAYNASAVANNPTIVIDGQEFVVGNGLEETGTPTGTVDDDSANDLVVGNEAAGSPRFQGQVFGFLFVDQEQTLEEIGQTQFALLARAQGRGTSGVGLYGQRGVFRGGNNTITGVARNGGVLTLVGGDTQSAVNSSRGGDVLVRAGSARGSGSPGRLTCTAGFGNQPIATTFGAEFGGETQTGANAASQTLFRGGDNNDTGAAGDTTLRGGDAVDGSGNDAGGSTLVRSGKARNGGGVGSLAIRTASNSDDDGNETGPLILTTRVDAITNIPGGAVGVADTESGNISIDTDNAAATTASASGGIAIRTGNTNGATGNVTGDISITAGSMINAAASGGSQDGGSVSITAGSTSGPGAADDGGDVDVTAGDAVLGTAGSCTRTAGTATGASATGGSIVDTAGGGTGLSGVDGTIDHRTASGGLRTLRTQDGGFLDTDFQEFTRGTQIVVNQNTTGQIVVGAASITVDGQNQKVRIYVTAVNDADDTDIVSEVIEQSFFRAAGTITALTAHVDDRQSNGAGVGLDIDFRLEITGNAINLVVDNNSSDANYTLNVALVRERQEGGFSS